MKITGLEHDRKEYFDNIKGNEEQLYEIVSNVKFINERKLLVKEYLKKKRNEFKNLFRELNISKHKTTGLFNSILSKPECLGMLYSYCVGLEIRADNPLDVVCQKLSKSDLASIRRCYKNLMIKHQGTPVKPDDKYWRYVKLREFVSKLKDGSGSIRILKDFLFEFGETMNRKYKTNFNLSRSTQIVQDLRDIFDVEPDNICGRNQVAYIVGDEWTIHNIRNIKCGNLQSTSECLQVSAAPSES